MQSFNDDAHPNPGQNQQVMFSYRAKVWFLMRSNFLISLFLTPFLIQESKYYGLDLATNNGLGSKVAVTTHPIQ